MKPKGIHVDRNYSTGTENMWKKDFWSGETQIEHFNLQNKPMFLLENHCYSLSGTQCLLDKTWW